MPKRCTPCMGKDIKDALRALGDGNLNKALELIVDCPQTRGLLLCGVRKSGRGRSAYQEFVSQCMKNKPIKGKPFGEAAKYMKQCSLEWRERKGG